MTGSVVANTGGAGGIFVFRSLPARTRTRYRTDVMGRTTKRTGKTTDLDPAVAVAEHEHGQHDAHETRTGGEDWRALRNRGRDELPAEYPEEGEHPPEEAVLVAEGEEDAHAPDDALGLYLRQMGAIPLLNREQELALA